MRQKDMAERALISSIGSLGNGGIVAVFAVLYYPHLPQIGKSIRLLCFVGTTCVVLGFGTASLSRNVSMHQCWNALALANPAIDLDSVWLPRPARRPWDRPFDQCAGSHPAGVFSAPKRPRPGDHVCL